MTTLIRKGHAVIVYVPRQDKGTHVLDGQSIELDEQSASELLTAEPDAWSIADPPELTAAPAAEGQ